MVKISKVVFQGSYIKDYTESKNQLEKLHYNRSVVKNNKCVITDNCELNIFSSILIIDDFKLNYSDTYKKNNDKNLVSLSVLVYNKSIEEETVYNNIQMMLKHCVFDWTLILSSKVDYSVNDNNIVKINEKNADIFNTFKNIYKEDEILKKEFNEIIAWKKEKYDL